MRGRRKGPEVSPGLVRGAWASLARSSGSSRLRRAKPSSPLRGFGSWAPVGWVQPTFLKAGEVNNWLTGFGFSFEVRGLGRVSKPAQPCTRGDGARKKAAPFGAAFTLISTVRVGRLCFSKTAFSRCRQKSPSHDKGRP